ncbi:hypothetical protein ACHAXN_002699, partial [Cyclotella atomus]
HSIIDGKKQRREGKNPKCPSNWLWNLSSCTSTLLHIAGDSRYLESIATATKSYAESFQKSALPATTAAASDDINIVSLTTSADFFVLFNNSAITSWTRHVRNVKSITFIGRPADEEEFWDNMAIHYPQFPTDQSFNSSKNSSPIADGALPTVRWVNETKVHETVHGQKVKVCQHLIKLHVFELSTELGHGYIGDNILIVDSDTVWARNVTFVNGSKVTYFGVDTGPCTGKDHILFTEAITAGPSSTNSSERAAVTHSPYLPTQHGLRVGHHHILFQRDVMIDIHHTIEHARNETSLWRAANTCFKEHASYCAGRVAEYLLYFAFLENRYPERITMVPLKWTVDVMNSGVCDEEEMKCCEQREVLMKGCHDHRVEEYRASNGTVTGDMCCT